MSTPTYPCVQITTGNGGQRLIILRHSSIPLARVEIYEFGAHVTRWVDPEGQSKIYCSPTAIFNGSKAIRGGIPVCFPQFGLLGPLKKQHGFARNMKWTLIEEDIDKSVPKVKFALEDNEVTRATEFPYRFRVEYQVTLDKDDGSVRIDYVVKNKGGESFEFTTALHAYFAADVKNVEIADLKGLLFKDNMKKMQEGVDDRDVLTFTGEVDRIYMATPDELRIPQAGLLIVKDQLPDAVVWNPFIEKTKSLADMPDDHWRNFVCIEPAATTPIKLEDGEQWYATLTLKSIK